MKTALDYNGERPCIPVDGWLHLAARLEAQPKATLWQRIVAALRRLAR